MIESLITKESKKRFYNTDIEKENKMTKNISWPKWLIDQKANAKFAWMVIVVLAGTFGYRITVTEEVNNPETISNVQEVVKQEVDKRMTLIMEMLEEINKKKPVPKIINQ